MSGPRQYHAREVYLQPQFHYVQSAANMVTPATVFYRCMHCGSLVGLTRSDPVCCSECGYNMLFKVRTKRMVQFDAR